MTDHDAPLTASEIGSLWTAYMDDSMAKCVLGEMPKHIQDEDIKVIVQTAYDISHGHLEQLTNLFKQENYAIPNAFSEENDVYPEAPWLFSDVFCLTFVSHLSILGLVAYSGALSMSIREDMRHYFTQCLSEITDLYNRASQLAIAKGVSPRPPYMEVPKATDYINSKDYLSGLNPFSEKRPLNAIEISHIYMNIMTNDVGSNLCLAFAQTSPTKDVQEFMLRASDQAKKIIQTFISLLTKENMQIPKAPDVNISNSTTQTFSDKLVMFMITQMVASGIGNDALSSAASQRLDLVAKYQKSSMDAGRLAKSGADIMIKYSWLEQPPGIKNKKKLAREKE